MASPIPKQSGLNPELCELCQFLFTTEIPKEVGKQRRFRLDFYRTIESWESPSTTASGGCSLCASLLRALHRQDDRRAVRIEEISAQEEVACTAEDRRRCYRREVSAYSYGGTLLSLGVDLYRANEEGELSLFKREIAKAQLQCFPIPFYGHLLSTSRLEARTDSEASWSVVEGWLDTCLKHHSLCNAALDNKTITVPTRLVYLSGSGNARVVVLDKSSEAPLYVTLSHCWGSHLPLKLTTANYADLQVGIPMDRVSKTFQNAFEVTLKMGLEYIWIDSLCIIQDSSVDWLAESSSMGDVYENPYCNIAAAFAPDGTHGCFVERNPEQLKPPAVTLSWGNNPGAYFVADGLGTSTYKEALGQRAWVCQERFLSPRVLYFNSTQIHWECSELGASEIFPRGVPGYQSRKSWNPEHDTTKRDRQAKVLRSWTHVLRDYVMKQLTYPTDKLVAVSGLAARLQKHAKCRYYAGLWEIGFAYQLLWRVETYPEPGVRRRVQPYIAPSWSWASMEGGIFFGQQTYASTYRCDAATFRILEIHVDLVDTQSPLGQVKGGYFRVKSPVAHGDFGIRTDPTSMLIPDLFYQDRCLGSAALDDRSMYEHDYPPGSAAKRPADENLWYLPVFTDRLFRSEAKDVNLSMRQGFLEGLILLPLPGSDPAANEFTRVGWFCIHDREGRGNKFQTVCRRTAEDGGLSYEDGEEPDDWGPGRVITIY